MDAHCDWSGNRALFSEQMVACRFHSHDMVFRSLASRHPLAAIAVRPYPIAGAALLLHFPGYGILPQAIPVESKEIYNIMRAAHSNVIERHSGAWYFYLDKMRIIFGEIMYMPCLLGLFYLSKRRSWSPMLFLGLWIALPILFLSAAATKRDTYLMILAPAFFLLIAYWIHAIRIRPGNLFWKSMAWLLLLLPLRYGLERSKIFQHRERNPVWSKELQYIKSNINTPPSKTVVFNVGHNIELMFHTGATAYSIDADAVLVDSLKAKGWEVWAYRQGKITHL
ncbi:MAG: hypothetical protein IPL65_07420 [Lewinellaceae bacterium]|nr:hypothetical protein [Lewinellaceae bacterium]